MITEIKAHALGARYYFPLCRTVLDVAGRTRKSLRLTTTGRVANFQMNDKCAAGTGRFLEIMATSLGIPLSEFRQRSASGLGRYQGDQHVHGFCRVRGRLAQEPWRFAEGHCEGCSSVCRRASCGHASPSRAYGDSVVFTGGVARNQAIVQLLRDRLEIAVLVPDEPDIVGALGAALYTV